MTGYRKTKRLAGQTDVWQQLDEIAAEQRATEGGGVAGVVTVPDPRYPNAESTGMVYRWGNNVRRDQLKGRRCVVLARGTMSTILVQFLDTGEKVTTSRRAVKRATLP